MTCILINDTIPKFLQCANIFLFVCDDKVQNNYPRNISVFLDMVYFLTRAGKFFKILYKNIFTKNFYF